MSVQERPSDALDENLFFLVVEVEKQLERARSQLRSPDDRLHAQVVSSEDYIDNLAASVSERALFSLLRTDANNQEQVISLKAYQVAATNLERISDFCQSLVDQLQYVEDERLFSRFQFDPFFDQVEKGLRQVHKGLTKSDHERALTICRSERKLDILYAKTFSKVLKQLEEPDSPQTLVTAVFMAHYLERMGDSLLNIGEAILSACLGERVRFDRLETLEASLEALDISDLSEIELKKMGETKSGATVAELNVAELPSVVLKEGKTKKLIEERKSVKRWNKLLPGIAPRIYDFQKGGIDSAAVFEFVQGATFEDHLLRADDESCGRALSRFGETIAAVWLRTKSEKASLADYTGQLKSRLKDVWAVHPEFQQPSSIMGSLRVASFEDLVERAAEIDAVHPCPFACTIHGDFNVDNMIYDASTDRVHFIDLHRSCTLDYVQDVSVFLVSNLRLVVFDKNIRRRINRSTMGFYRFAKKFAKKNADRSFEIRLALGMARSLVTSTRFVLDERLAKTLFLKSRYLLERLTEAHAANRLSEFCIPTEALVD